MMASLHRDIISGLFVRARLPSDSLRAALRGENTWGAPSFGLIYGPVKEEEIVFARALRGLAATFLRFAPIVCLRGMSAANFRPHLKARSREKTISALFFARDALDRFHGHLWRNCIVKKHLASSNFKLALFHRLYNFKVLLTLF